ncbi:MULTISPECIES: preprotein translocase subunit YajC [unclassified Saccharopolyspora]|uniref:preprotein translocase subunit YajC n=1 Tax=unclassified Saccharopolyspora TaxID=2646250 RepID=UPI001CD6C10C|nr:MULTISPECIES: preprotein translocase subunit YajC [unclassified Saccharopolyspora]MCA1189223.1 preprotein translocase subunit YajC [Saccharopolyspora sp. 6T]MCA1192728.1 preprotein translocase subunit YajC [Saccharopolyspora sp. 6V]MCA1225345.1 preprotein translocase subunit YajC [Saccharopolyspora sp. 6M]MCA1279506.1 preprotein translocase subunit YajC [Saccharopolyspora sp. 7B]
MSFESLFLPLLIVLLAVPMFLQARKQKRAVQEQQKLQNSLTAGDRVMTTSGLFGTVVSSADDSIDLEIAPGVVTTWVRAAVREKVTTEEAAEAPATEQDEAAPAAEAKEAEGEQKDATEATSESSAQIAEPIEKQKTS